MFLRLFTHNILCEMSLTAQIRNEGSRRGKNFKRDENGNRKSSSYFSSFLPVMFIWSAASNGINKTRDERDEER